MSRRIMIPFALAAGTLALVLLMTTFTYAGEGGSCAAGTCPLKAAAVQKAEGEGGHMNQAMDAAGETVKAEAKTHVGKHAEAMAKGHEHAAGKMCENCKAAGDGKMCQKCPAGKKAAHREQVAAAVAKIDAAQAALQAGDATKATAALVEAKAVLEKIQTAMRPAVVNATCPIMGGNAVKADAPAKLYREFQGKGVAFCCGGCPAAWDKLSDEQKAEKLAAATAKK